jgi:hypothetical protein
MVVLHELHSGGNGGRLGVNEATKEREKQSRQGGVLLWEVNSADVATQSRVVAACM